MISAPLYPGAFCCLSYRETNLAFPCVQSSFTRLMVFVESRIPAAVTNFFSFIDVYFFYRSGCLLWYVFDFNVVGCTSSVVNPFSDTLHRAFGCFWVFRDLCQCLYCYHSLNRTSFHTTDRAHSSTCPLTWISTFILTFSVIRCCFSANIFMIIILLTSHIFKTTKLPGLDSYMIGLILT